MKQHELVLQREPPRGNTAEKQASGISKVSEGYHYHASQLKSQNELGPVSKVKTKSKSPNEILACVLIHAHIPKKEVVSLK